MFGFLLGVGGNILLPWTLWDAKISRAIWVIDSGGRRGEERAIPL